MTTLKGKKGNSGQKIAGVMERDSEKENNNSE